MKKEQVNKILEELEARKIATIDFSDGSKIILKFNNLYGISLFVFDKYQSFVRTFKTAKELTEYLKYINIY